MKKLDVAKGILILTGGTRLETETDRITARDSLEYWEKQNLAVARGNAIAIRGENRLRADVLTAHFAKDGRGQSRVRQVDALAGLQGLGRPVPAVRMDLHRITKGQTLDDALDPTVMTDRVIAACDRPRRAQAHVR